MKKGFTIAEVLITLAVIGVIATITVPTVKAKIQQKECIAALKKIHTELQEAFRLAAYDLGYNPRCGYWQDLGQQLDRYKAGNTKTEYDSNGNPTWWYKNDKGEWVQFDSDPTGENSNGIFTDCVDFGKAITNRLGVAAICETDCYRKGFIPEYEGNDTVLLMNAKSNGDLDKFINERAAEDLENFPDKYKEGTDAYNNAVSFYKTKGTGGTSGYRKSTILNYNTAILLENGAIIENYMGNQGYFHPRYFAVDVNGKRGPNKWGYDLFPFQAGLTEDGQNVEVYPTDDKYKYVEPGGLTTSQALKQ